MFQGIAGRLRQAGACWTARPSAGLIKESLDLIRVAAPAKVDHNPSRLAVQRDRRGIDPIMDRMLIEHFPEAAELGKGSIRYGPGPGRLSREAGHFSSRRS